MKDSPYIIMPLHKRTDLIKQCCKLINSEWKRSEVARLRSLQSSCDKFPTCLVLLDVLDTYVIGHCKISLIPNACDSCFVESVVIDRRYRSRGLGSLLMRETEEYVARRGIKTVYLSTKGQERFYEKLGYTICEPLRLLGNRDSVCDSVQLSMNDNDLTSHTKSPGPPPPPMPNIKNNTFPISTTKTYMMKKL